MMKGWPVLGFFVETGVSGSIPLADRPEGARLIAAVSKGDAIISPKLDRMFRSASDALATLEELKGEGIALHLIDLGGDVTGNGIGKLTFTILAAVAESERDRIRERIRDVKRHLAQQGVYNGGKRPFGFKVVDRRLMEDPVEQATIKRMKTERRKGLTTMEIAGLLGAIIREEKPAKVNIDVGGLGIGIYERLIEQGHDSSVVTAVNFGGKPLEPPPLDEAGRPGGGPANRRAEMWSNMRKCLQGRFAIPDSDSLQGDLVSVG